jgi:hypothetical protein
MTRSRLVVAISKLGWLLYTKINYGLILQHFGKIANYANYIFKNGATYGNLILIVAYLSKFINK